MDRLDRLSIWAIVILIISSSALISHHVGETKSGRDGHESKTTLNSPIVLAESVNEVQAIKSLIEGNNLYKAEMLVNELIQKYPYEGEPRMLLGDIFMRRQDPVKAILEYKEAVDLNADYLDKNAPLFQGKKIKVAVKEATAEIEKRIKANPEDAFAKKFKKDVYYLQRKIAGSCS